MISGHQMNRSNSATDNTKHIWTCVPSDINLNTILNTRSNIPLHVGCPPYWHFDPFTWAINITPNTLKSILQRFGENCNWMVLLFNPFVLRAVPWYCPWLRSLFQLFYKNVDLQSILSSYSDKWLNNDITVFPRP